MLHIWKIDYSAFHDGPGIRMAVYLKGCPLRCIWCANPEGQSADPNLVFTASRCIDCGLCVETCAANALEVKTGEAPQQRGIRIDRNGCDLCGKCAAACSPGALEIWGKPYSTGDILSLAEKNRPIFRKSGGGITLTGGEPLEQWQESLELLELCRERGIHTAMETSAYADEAAFEKMIGRVDWLFIDLKHMDPEHHLRLTGKPNEPILNNVKIASSMFAGRGRGLIIRMVVVPGVNDGDNMVRAAEFFRSLPHVPAVEFLPYHRYAVTKYELLNRTCRMPDLEPPSEELLEQCRQIMKSSGIAADAQGLLRQ